MSPTLDPKGESGRSATPGPDEGELVAYLARYFESSGAKFLLVTGPSGSGKSTLLRSILPELDGPKVFLAYQAPPASPGTRSTDPTQLPVPMLLVDPQAVPSDGPTPEEGPSSGALLAFSPRDAREGAESLAPLTEAAARISPSGNGSVVVDSWDRSTETFFRSQAPGSAFVRTFAASATDLFRLQSSIVSTPVRLLVATTAELGEPLSSIADAIVALREEEYPDGRLRVVRTTVKALGTVVAPPEALYTLDGGTFRSLPGLPTSFRAPITASEPDPEPGLETGWPGSAALAELFGRLRFGGMTGFTHAGDCPDTVPIALAAPVVGHALASGGRVVWILPPSLRPSRIVALLREVTPDDWIRERLRLLSASGDDPGLGEMRGVLLPLSGAASDGADRRPSPGTSVAPIFPSAFRFLRDHSPSTPALYVASLEGLRAGASVAGVTVDAATLPAVASFYTRVPRFHLFAYAGASDPAAPMLKPMVDTLFHLEMHHGRPVVFGIRPKRPPMVLDWPDPKGRFALVPAA